MKIQFGIRYKIETISKFMSKPVISLITSPDKLFNDNPSVLLVNPSDSLKESFNNCAAELKDSINLYLFEGEDVGWLIDIAQSCDYIILDVDNTRQSQWIVGYLLQMSKTFYLTNDTNIVYNKINVNKIFEFEQFMEGVNYFEIQ